ncbi:MAG: tandem-95 repeat protein, partial [Alphaproteobacteria bacterium]|nr:tandem-95 repeat protein [Alphaproteobacteria bacterium]
DIRVRATATDLIISFAGSDDSIRIAGTINNADNRIETLRFDDGRTLSHAELVALATTIGGVLLAGDGSGESLAGGSGDDTISGNAGGDTLGGGAGADSLLGGEGGDLLLGEAGNDALEGGTGNDSFAGGTGHDTISDAEGDDRFDFAPGDGEDRITDRGGNDSLILAAGIAPDDITVSLRAGNDIILQFGATTDRIELLGAFGTSANAIERIAFDDGTLWTPADLIARANAGTDAAQLLLGSGAADTLDSAGGDDSADGRDGNDLLLGGAGSDSLQGGAGNDTLDGGNGADTLGGGLGSDLYRFAAGQGIAIVTDSGGADTLEFGAGILAADLAVSVRGQDLVLRIGAGEDRVVLAGVLASAAAVIEQLRLHDGSVLTHADLVALAAAGSGPDQTIAGSATSNDIAAGEGNDSIDGLGGDDTLDGGTGSDTIVGGAGDDDIAGGRGPDQISDASGNDTYRFAAGDGLDAITDLGGNDAILLGDGLSLADLRARSTSEFDLVIRFAGTEDGVRLVRALGDPATVIEELRFADGSVRSFAELVAASRIASDGADAIYGAGTDDNLAGAEGDDLLDGSTGSDTLQGERGNDSLVGGSGNDLLDGGGGADTLAGGAGNDLYRFAPGDGLALIQDSGGLDAIAFAPGLTSADVVVRKLGTALELRFAGSEDRLTLSDAIGGTGTIETVSFADGTVWDAAELLRRSTAGTPEDDAYTGTANADLLAGLGGSDTLSALGGSDTLDGGDEADSLDGGAGADLLRGGRGNDTLIGGAGADTYAFLAGDGVDTIRDQGDATADTLRIEGYAPDALRFSKTGPDGTDLTIRFGGSTDRIVVASAFAPAEAGRIEQFVVAATGTTLTLAEIEARVQPDIGTEGEVLYGDAGDNLLSGGGLADFLAGGDGADTLLGGDGDDIVDGIVADAQTDLMTGGAGRDTYRYLPSFAISDGIAMDVITDFVPGDAGDIISLFASNPNPFFSGRLQLRQSGADTDVVLYNDVGAGRAVLRLVGVDATQLVPANFGGVALEIDTSAVRDGEEGNVIPGEPLHDLVFGNGGADTISGFGGSDTLAGGADGDVIAGGFGDDRIAGEAGHDLLTGGAGNDILSGGSGNDTLTGGDADAEFAGADIFSGGAGDDSLAGGGENDIYLFGAQDGHDRLTDGGGTDRIEFAAGIAPEDVAVRQRGADLELRVDGGTTKLLLIGAASTAPATDIETILFADGQSWDRAALLTRAMATTSGDDLLAILTGNTLDGLGGNDELTGSDAADTIAGGTGDDLLRGGAGGDTYVFRRGDGQDAISDTQGDNLIFLGPGIAPEDIRLVRGLAIVVLEIVGTGDRLDLGWAADPGMAIREIRFDGGAVWTAADVAAMALAGSEGDDLIHGTQGAETLSGLAGDDRLLGKGGDDRLTGGTGVDLLEGGLGDDIYVFLPGDDQDRILDEGGSADLIRLGAGILPGDVRVTQSSDGSAIVLHIGSAGDRIRIEDALGAGRIELVRFEDGTEWSVADLLLRVPTALDDVLFGDNDAQILAGGLGDDRLSGGGGADEYRFAAGDGRDIIRDNAASLGDRLVISGYTAAQVTFTRLGTDSSDVTIGFLGSHDRILLADALDTHGRAIEEIVLSSDGTSLTVADIAALLVDAQVTDGDDVVFGGDGSQTLAGGRGDDLLVGGEGNDLYLYARGDGDDRVDARGNGQSVVQLSGYDAADVVSAVRAGPSSLDLVVTFEDDGDRLVLVGALGASGGVQANLALRFDDGTAWNRTAMQARAIEDIEGPGHDNVYGFSGADLFDLSGGNDFASGFAGSDRYIFGAGDGHDRIEDSGTSASETDIVEFVGLGAEDAAVSRLFRGSDTVVIRFAGNTADSLTVMDALAGDARSIESYVFAGGVTWTPATILALLDNNPAVAHDDGYYSVVTGGALTVLAADVLRNDFDADDDILRIVAVDGSPDGAATLDGSGNIVFTPEAGFVGATAFTYRITDGRNAFAEASVNVNVRPIAEARDDTGFLVAEDDFTTIRVERLLSNDVDGDRMIVGQVFGAIGGTVSLSSNGEIGFTPDANHVGPAQFRYAANTPEGGRAEATVFLTVTPVNDVPIAQNDQGLVTDENASITVNPSILIANDDDIDGDVLTLHAVQSSASLLVSINAAGNIVVTPRDDFFGAGSFSYAVIDAAGAISDFASVAVTVRPVNDAPQAGDDRIELTQAGDPVLEDNPIILSLARLTANDIDIEGDELAFTDVRLAVGGRARLLDNQTVLFEPFADFNGEASFQYRVDDGQGGSDTATVTILYQPVNDRPDAVNDHYSDEALYFLRGTEDVPIEIPIVELLKNDRDIEGFAVTFENATGAVHGDIEIVGDIIIFTPDADFSGEATFGYSITDPEGLVDGALVTLFFEGNENEAPVAVADEFLVPEDIPVTIRLSTLLGNDTDADGDPVQVIGWRHLNGLGDVFTFGGEAAGPINGRIELDENGDLLFSPNIDANFSSGFVYIISDGVDGTAEGFIDLVIIPSNDDPTVVDDTGFVTPFDIPLVIRVADLVFNDFDIEQADEDGDGVRDADLDDPDRPRPSFVGVDAILDPAELAQGNRVAVGDFEIVSFRGEQFLVARFTPGFSGPVTIEYRIADEEGLEDVGYAYATVADYYGGELSGTPLVDYIEGNAGGETIRGYRRDDWVIAKEGDDVVETGTGDDRIEAGSGDDTIDAGDGGDDISGGDGFDLVRFAGSNVGVRADLLSLIGQGGFAQGDLYSGIEAFEGTSFNDTLGGDGDGDSLAGLDGHDELEGRGGSDTLAGGAGNDRLDGGDGGDLLEGGEGSDTASYFFAPDAVRVSLAAGSAAGSWAAGDTLSGIENLAGSAFADSLEGDAGANLLSGDRGADTLVGGAGDDELSGGRGADLLSGGDGIDTADYTLSTTGIAIDIAAGTAGGGDAEGDTLSGIEIIQASDHDDSLAGDDADNRLRGSRGADTIDGRGGFDAADYARAEEAVVVDLALGEGLAGEALGDRLASIEMLVGSVFADTLIGAAGSEVFDGGFGDDLLRGGSGSDDYRFGFDSSEDRIAEAGDAGDLDRLVLGAGIAAKDLSLLRLGDDLFVEIERDDGFLIDTVTVTGHFLGESTGIEQIAFADGTSWDRAAIQDRLRLGRFNAQDDIVRLGIEDEVLLIDPAVLILNDAEAGIEDLVLVSVQHPRFGAVEIVEGGMIAFLGAQDHNGDAFFSYTVRDPLGRESTARVEVNLSPVNDAPVANDDPLVYGLEDVPLRIRIENLLANDYDVDGDHEQEGLHIIGAEPLTNAAGVPLRPYKNNDYDGEATDATWKLDGQYIEILSRPDHFGFAGFRYILADASGATSTADVEIYFAPVNDAPRITSGRAVVKLEETTTISVAQLMAKVYDVEGDAFEFVGLHIGADGNAAENGVEVFDEAAGTIAFTPSALGDASIAFDVIDARGAEATLSFGIRVRPQNLPPIANDDYGLRLLEDDIIVIDPALLLLNDSDPDGDALSFIEVYRFAVNGKVRVNDEGMIEFAAKSNYNGPASFEYTVSDGRGGTDTAVAHLTILPRNSGPVLRNDVVQGVEDGPQYVIPAEAFGNDLDLDGDVIFFLDSALLGVFATRFLSPDFTVEAKAGNNRALPDWLSFDEATLTFTGIPPAEMDAPQDVAVFLTDPSNGAVHAFRFAFDGGDAAALAAGLSVADTVLGGFTLRQAYEWTLDADGDRVATFDIAEGSFTATRVGGRPLPDWLGFDAASRQFFRTGFEPEADDVPVRIQLTFTPSGLADLPEHVYRSTTRGFTIEFLIDPAEPLEPAINAIIAGDPLLEAQGLFGIDLAAATSLVATRESGAPLDNWLSFDAETMRFAGMPPSQHVGAVPVRIAVAGDGLPPMWIITEAVVDETFTVAEDSDGVSVADLPERITLTTPPDFNGSVAFTYDAHDEKGGTSAEPAIIVLNVAPRRELPVGTADRFELFESGAVSFLVTTLLDNDRDDDGDPLRVLAVGAPDHGSLEISLSTVLIAPPEALEPVPGGSWSAALADGSALPGWMTLDTATGAVTATVPLGVLGSYEIRFTSRDGTTTSEATRTLALDGNAGALVTYTPDAGFAGLDTLLYTVTDEREGPVAGTVTLDVLSLFDPPIAVTDTLSMFEDGVLVIDPAQLLANDRDVDGDAFRFLGVLDPANGTVVFEDDRITFTPVRDFAGVASFRYELTDDRHGTSQGLVEVIVQSTNRRPTATADVFATVEDTPFEFTIADLLANDTDLDGDSIRFVSIQSSGPDGRILELPDNRYQFVPDENVNGPLEYRYSVTDGRLSASGVIRFEIAAVNDAPIANPDGLFFGDQDTPLVIDFADMLFNDRDVEGHGFRIVDVFDGDNGTVVRDGDTAVFLGRPGYFGDGGFHYRVTDDLGATSTGYVSVLVFPEFEVPVAVSDAGFEVLEDGFIEIDPAVLMANDDIPVGSDVRFLGLTGPGVTLLESGLYRVAPAADFFGTLTLRYALTNETGFEVPTTVRIEVLPVSDGPTAADDHLTIAEDTTLAIFVTALTDNDFDVDRQAVTLTRILGSENIAVELLDDGQVVIAPPPQFNGEAWFDYELRDSTGSLDTARVTVTVEARNDAPVIVAPAMLAAREDTPFSVSFPAGFVTDADGDAVLVELRSPGGAGLPDWLSYDRATRTLAGTPPADANGAVQLEIAAFDDTVEVLRAVTLVIEAVNDAPVVFPAIPGPAAFGIEENSTAVITVVVAEDVERDPITFAITGGADAGRFVIDEATGALALRSGLDFEDPADTNGDNVYEVVVAASDGALQGTRTLAITILDAQEVLSGTAWADTLSGDDGADGLLGRGGSDLLDGGVGDDDLFGGQGDDSLQGGLGNDSLRGGVGDDLTVGGDGDDTMVGFAGADTMVGGAGDDIHVVDDPGDLVVEQPGEGFDFVKAWLDVMLAAEVERLLLLGADAIGGTGNALDNVLIGNLAGNGLAGGDGADTLSGGAGNDTLAGGAGHDLLHGGPGADSMAGGDGDDTYFVDDAGDAVIEASGEGSDLVKASVDFVLAAEVERLVLLGTDAIDGTGNALDNVLLGNAGGNNLAGGDGNDTIVGGAGDDTLEGGAGSDVLKGGMGLDTFRYGAAVEGNDIIVGYVGEDDAFEVSASAFGGGLSEGMDLLATERYVENATGAASSAAGVGQFVFETDTGQLRWDADGQGGGAAVVVAQFVGASGWAGSEIAVIA